MIDVHGFVQVYNFCFENGGIYAPTDQDKAMIEDAINCYVAECEQAAAESGPPCAIEPCPGYQHVSSRLAEAEKLIESLLGLEMGSGEAALEFLERARNRHVGYVREFDSAEELIAAAALSRS